MNSTQMQRIINVVIDNYIQRHSPATDFSKLLELSEFKDVNDLNDVNSGGNVISR